MAVCEACGRDLEEVAPFSRRRSDGERETIDLCDACRTGAASVGETVTCTRKAMLAVRDLADKRMLPTSLYRGQRIIGYRESRGLDGRRWHAQVVLEDGTRVFLDEAE
jgi:hypothetical protein